MICTDIISEGRFLRMSMTAQALYMHLLGNADDDGIVDAFTIMRMVGAKEDDLLLLREREYITVLDEKEWILWITNWQIFNTIAPHTKNDSKFLPLLRTTVKGIEIVKSTKKEDNKRRYDLLKIQRQSRKLNTDDPIRITGGSLGGSLSDQGHDPNSKRKEKNINKKEINKEKVAEAPLAPSEQEAVRTVVEAWNETNFTRLKGMKPGTVRNLHETLQVHSLEDVLEAVRNQKKCSSAWLKDIGLDTLLRQKDKSGQPVDYVGEILRSY